MPSLYTCALRLLAAAFMFANCGAAALLKAVPGITQRAVPRPAAAVGDAAPGVVDNAHLPLGIGLELIDSLPALQLKCENVTQGLAASPCWSSSKARAADSAAPLGQGLQTDMRSAESSASGLRCLWRVCEAVYHGLVHVHCLPDVGEFREEPDDRQQHIAPGVVSGQRPCTCYVHTSLKAPVVHRRWPLA
mmetsp:Transcript_299/g.980  ORF Transcript_299/g.980 Transcript_299/m.980 type:complete len:191 (-) Transcript_299:68-640(-)